MKKNILPIVIALVILLGSVSATFLILHGQYESDIEKANSDVEALQAQLRDLESDCGVGKEILTDMIHRVDYKNETVYVIGHKSPDSDTTFSAIAMAYFLNHLGISAEARMTAAPNLESDYVFTRMNYPIPEVLEDASGKQLWLVDHSTSTQMVKGADKARIVGITDHHGIGDVETSEPICILSCPAGSTCAVVYRLCTVCGVELPKDLASVLLAGLLSDTANMLSNSVTKLDEIAFEELKALSGITDTNELFSAMLEAKISYMSLEDRQIFYSDYKDYEHNGFRYGIGCVKVATDDLIPAMAERMQAVIKTEMQNGCEADFILYNVYDTDYSTGYIGIVGKDAEFVEVLMETVFGDTMNLEDEYYIFTPSLARNKAIVPPIDAYLDTLE